MIRFAGQRVSRAFKAFARVAETASVAEVVNPYFRLEPERTESQMPGPVQTAMPRSKSDLLLRAV